MSFPLRSTLLGSLCCAALLGCSHQPASEAVTTSPSAVHFILFGDSGYHYDYLKDTIRNNPQDMAAYLADEQHSWLKKGLPAADFTPPPAHQLNEQQVIEASGLYPVAAAMTSHCRQQGCDLALMMGDNIYPAGADGSAADARRFEAILDQPFRPLLASDDDFRIYAMLGNHDWQTSRAGRDAQVQWFNAADNPQMVLPEPGFYSFTRGDAEFFILDTNLLLAATDVLDDRLNPDGSEMQHEQREQADPWLLPQGREHEQLSWFKQAIRESPARWKIVAGHHPLWTSGGTKFEQARALRHLLLPTLCDYADMYLAGHEHDLEIHTDACGENQLPLPVIVSGAASKQRPVHTPFQQYQRRHYPQYREIWLRGMSWGFTRIELNGEQADVTMITTPDDGSGAAQPAFQVSFPRRH